MKTLVVNLFGGPGVSKSTTAAGVFYLLKSSGVNSELVREYAKERVWLGDDSTMQHQAYVTIKQYFRQCQVDGKVSVIVTDSPILLGLVYPGRGSTPKFKDYLLELWDEFNNLNILLKRDTEAHPYNQAGRMQDLAGAEQKDREIKALLEETQTPYIEFGVTLKTARRVYDLVMNELLLREPHCTPDKARLLLGE